MLGRCAYDMLRRRLLLLLLLYTVSHNIMMCATTPIRISFIVFIIILNVIIFVYGTVATSHLKKTRFGMIIIMLI